MITVTFIDVVAMCVVFVSGVLIYVLYRLAVLSKQVDDLREWARDITYILVTEVGVRSTAGAGDRRHDLGREPAAEVA